MTPEQITFVQQSLPAVLAIRETAAARFHDRLFTIDPTARPLFAGADMRGQGAKLMGAIAMLVSSLSRFDAIHRDVPKLAQHHVGYGVEPHHFDSVGSALLWTLEQGLGSACTPELSAAWAAAYRVLSDTMLQTAPDPMAA